MKKTIPLHALRPIVLVTITAVLLAGCGKPDSDDQPAAPKPETGKKAKLGVTLNVGTRERLGIKIESPAPGEWRTGTRATGLVINPFTFLAAAADYETVRTTAGASQAELERTQKLAAQDNASSKVLEAAQAGARRDSLALEAARAKFAADWGAHLANQTNLTAFARKFQDDGHSFIKITLPVGLFPSPLPTAALVYPFGDDTNSVAANFFDSLNIDPATQTQSLLFSADKKLSSDQAITALAFTSTNTVAGLIVPAIAVVRHEGRGWVYVETEPDQFVRRSLPLDRLTDHGWFTDGALTASNRVVTVGAQAVLSAELSNGGFTTGERD